MLDVGCKHDSEVCYIRLRTFGGPTPGRAGRIAPSCVAGRLHWIQGVIRVQYVTFSMRTMVCTLLVVGSCTVSVVCTSTRCMVSVSN